MTYTYVWPRVLLNFPSQTTLNVGPYLDYQRIFEEEFGPRRTATQAGAFAGPDMRETVYSGLGAIFNTTPDRHWNVSASYGWTWNGFDYDFGGGPRFPRVSPAALANPGAPLDPGKGFAHGGTIAIGWIPVPALRVDASYEKSALRRNDTRRIAFDENVWSAQTAYRFGRFLSVRLRADYKTSTSNIRPQVLLAWTPNPGTALYAGYNDDLNRNGYSPVTGVFQRGLERNSRTAFVKISYLVGR